MIMDREQIVAIMAAILYAGRHYEYSDMAKRKEAAVEDAIDLLDFAEDCILPPMN